MEIFNEYEVFKDAASVGALYFHPFVGRESRRQIRWRTYSCDVHQAFDRAVAGVVLLAAFEGE